MNSQVLRPFLSRIICFILLTKMRKLTILFWLLFWLFIYKLAFLSKDKVQAQHAFRIYRDEEGIPHIFAKTYDDILYGLGYAEAQDRLFGLFIKKMLVGGRLGEYFGADAVLSDLQFRNIGFSEMGRRNLAVTKPETVKLAQSYANGINQYARTAKLLPLQFYLFWIQWDGWGVEDTLAYINFLSFNLEFDWFYQIARQRLLQTAGYDLGVKIITYGSNNLFKNVTILSDDELKQMGRYKEYNLSEQDHILKKHWVNSNISIGKVHFPHLQLGVAGAGSNAWIIGGNLTQNGKPILANDPHVASMIPSLFYCHEVVLLDEDNNIINRKFGVMPQGIPSISLGIGKDYAFGSTAAYIDNKDIYYETVRNNSGKMQYLFKDEWVDFKERKQILKVRGGSDIEQTYYHTHRGVVIETIFMDLHWKYGYPLPDKYKNNHTISLSALHFQPDNSSLEGHLKLLTSSTIQGHYEATKLIQHPNIDCAFICRNGTIGYNSVGSIPKRDIPEMGSFIKDGNTDIYDIKGVLDDSQEPYFINPSKGYMGFANNKFASDHYEFRSSLQQIVTGRSYRIQKIMKDAIAKNKKFNIEDMKMMQLDQKDQFVADVMPKIVAKLEQHRQIWQSQINNKIINKLKKWDYIMDKDSVQASFYQVWEYLFQNSLFKLVGLSDEEVQAIINHGYFENYQFTLLEKIGSSKLTDEERPVCESHQTRKYKHIHPCQASIALAFKQLPNELKKLFKSDDLQEYRWGGIHNQQFRLIPMSQIPLLNKIWQRTFPAGGNSRTLNVAIISHQSKTYDTLGNPIFRFITDLDETYYSLDVGQSANILSPFYDNFLGKDKYVAYVPKNPFKEPLPQGWRLDIDTID